MMKLKLTEAQIEVLELLKSGPKESTRITRHEYVNGSTATALVRKGYAKRLYYMLKSGVPSPFYRYEITPNGLEALSKIKGQS